MRLSILRRIMEIEDGVWRLGVFQCLPHAKVKHFIILKKEARK